MSHYENRGRIACFGIAQVTQLAAKVVPSQKYWSRILVSQPQVERASSHSMKEGLQCGGRYAALHEALKFQMSVALVRRIG